ncbi:MAG: hypothetical protein NTV44_00190 [Firmicutes bacterium]|nr:hypothetical protein [Bacillota bacterium]
MTAPQKKAFKAFLTRLLVLLIVFLLFMVSVYALINQYLPHGVDNPWWIALYIVGSILLYLVLVFVVERSRKKRRKR